MKVLVSKSTEEFYFTKFQPYQPWGNFEFNLFAIDNFENSRPFFRSY
jgi:hypothetical protein